ncbi:hypothetical protein [Candidatus Phytoplasma fabacearum]|uniref:hypothetical protein n=1 Tax=Candidatus Phytoplasma fabacearum TaxID=2982628 RepID=UPI0030ED333F
MIWNDKENRPPWNKVNDLDRAKEVSNLLFIDKLWKAGCWETCLSGLDGGCL